MNLKTIWYSILGLTIAFCFIPCIYHSDGIFKPEHYNFLESIYYRRATLILILSCIPMLVEFIFDSVFVTTSSELTLQPLKLLLIVVFSVPNLLIYIFCRSSNFALYSSSALVQIAIIQVTTLLLLNFHDSVIFSNYRLNILFGIICGAEIVRCIWYTSGMIGFGVLCAGIIIVDWLLVFVLLFIWFRKHSVSISHVFLRFDVSITTLVTNEEVMVMFYAMILVALIASCLLIFLIIPQFYNFAILILQMVVIGLMTLCPGRLGRRQVLLAEVIVVISYGAIFGTHMYSFCRLLWRIRRLSSSTYHMRQEDPCK